MSTPKLSASLCTLVALFLPAVAQAGKIEHRGTVEGAPQARVGFAVKLRSGEPRRISNMSFIDVPVTCENGSSGKISGFLPPFRVGGNDFSRRGKIRGKGIEDGFLRVAGGFSARGKRASGEVRFSFRSSQTGAGCGTDEVAWKTRRR